MADGGDGTVDAAVAAGFERREVRVAGPLSHEVTAAFALRAGTTVVEMAEASGLQLALPPGPSVDSPPSLGTGHSEKNLDVGVIRTAPSRPFSMNGRRSCT